MSRRYPEYTSINPIWLQLCGSMVFTFFLYYSVPIRAPPLTRYIVSSGGLGLTILTVDILLDYLKHTRKSIPASPTSPIKSPSN